MFQSVRGTKDILPPEILFWQKIEETGRKIIENYGYKELRTPIIEEEKLFIRSLGDTTEVVNKQMFFVKRLGCGEKEDQDEGSLVLRPEGTAAVARAYIENNLDKKYDFVKFYYFGAMFRAERPQKGRLRQFHHLGVEAIGSDSPYLDVELISLAKRLLEAFGVDDFQINLNSLGCQNDKNKFILFIKDALKGKIDNFCPDCQRRYQSNVLRILDCKNKTCRQILKDIVFSEGFLCPQCKQHFQQVEEGLKILGIPYNLVPFLVRGLDYYTRTVFEITHQGLGTQDALGAGGRYDDLLKQLGGPSKPAAGFALGIERVLLAIKEEEISKDSKLVYIIGLDAQAKKEALKMLRDLRESGLCADMDYQDKSLRAALRKANSLNARFVIILGEAELKNKKVKLKDMRNSTEIELGFSELAGEIKKRIC